MNSTLKIQKSEPITLIEKIKAEIKKTCGAKGQTDVAKGPKTAGETLMSLVDQLVGIIGFLEYTIST